MKKYFFYIFIGLFVFKNLFANNVDIQENIDLKFYCELEKKIIKDSEYNYQVFLANDLDIINLEKFEIKAKKPEIFSVQGLSSFFTNTLKFKVTVVNKDVVLFKAFDKDENYSESAIINRKSGELVHEITKNLKSENFEKNIIFYSCKKKEKKV
tara:strand:- start:540 stop:1001 length:462 start_codon:yes stop_codon:yes gene_type:complete